MLKLCRFKWYFFTNNQMRPWKPFERKEIRLFGTNKTNPKDQSGRAYGRRRVTEGNCLDPVKGCSSTFCEWCYARESCARYHILFNVPVPQVLREDLLRKDLRMCSLDWVRIGVMGEPSEDWELTAKVAKVCAEEGKRVAIITRLLKLPNHSELQTLADIGTVINWSISPTDPVEFIKSRWESVRTYPYLVLRLLTFAFADGCEESKMQAWLSSIHPHILEQPARVFRTLRVWPKLDHKRYHHPPSYIVGSKGPSRWLTAGPVLNVPVCCGHCSSCPWKCGLVFFESSLSNHRF